MSVHPVYHPDDRQRVREAKARRIAPSSLRPQPRVIAWDVRWREAPGENASNHRFAKADGFERADAESLDRRIRRSLRETGGYASRAQVFGHPDDSVPTLLEYAHETFVPFVMENLKPSTQRLYLEALDNYVLTETPRRKSGDIEPPRTPTEISKMPLDKIGAREISSWRAGQIQRRPSPRRVEIAVEVLQSLFGLALEDGVIELSPLHGQRSRRVHGRRRQTGVRRVDPVKPERVVDPITIESLCRQRELLGRVRDVALIRLLAIEGLRPGEATVFRWHELVDENARARHTATIARTWSEGPERWVEVDTPKNGAFRVIKLFAPVRETIEEFYDWCGKPDLNTDVFIRSTGRKFTPQDAHDMLKHATKLSGIKHFPPYDLRHTAASLLQAGGDNTRPGVGWSVGEIAAHLGHSIEVCSRTYLHVFKEPSRYRGVPIEQVFVEARAAAVLAFPGEPVLEWRSRHQRIAYGWSAP